MRAWRYADARAPWRRRATAPQAGRRSRRRRLSAAARSRPRHCAPPSNRPRRRRLSAGHRRARRGRSRSVSPTRRVIRAATGRARSPCGRGLLRGVPDHDAGDRRCGQRTDQPEKLLQLVDIGIGDVDDIFVLDREPLGGEIGLGVAQIELVDDRRFSVWGDGSGLFAERPCSTATGS